MPFLESITNLWLKQVEVCDKAKERQFGKAAKRAWHYLGRDYSDINIEIPAPEEEEEGFPVLDKQYRPAINKSREFVALYLPHLHHKVPHRLTAPRRPEVPIELAELMPEVVQYQGALRKSEEILCWMLKWWLNYLPREYDLFREARTAIPEALVKGRGVCWCEMIDGPYGPMPASIYGSVDDLLIDSDCRQMRDAGFIIRRRQRGAYQVAEETGWPIEQLRSAHKTGRQKAAEQAGESQWHDQTHGDKRGDVCTYYQIWSRMGIGHHLAGAGDDIQKLTAVLDELGPYVYLEVMPGLKQPLNFGPDMRSMSGEELKARLEWPIALHQNSEDPWPCTVLDFYPNAADPWAASPLSAGLPIQRFLDHVYRYLQKRVRTSCRNIILTSCELEEAVDDALQKGMDLEIVKTKGRPGDEIRRLVEVLKFPEVHQSLFQVIPMMERQFERLTGMDALLGGAQPERMERSAQAARDREAHLMTRPQDFAEVTEAWNSRLAAKEAIATRMYVGPGTVAPLFGEPVPDFEAGLGDWGPLTDQWMRYVMTDDPANAAGEVHYTVEAGSGQRKNKQKQLDDARSITELVMPHAFSYGQLTGNFEPLNNVLNIVGEAAEMPMQRVMFPSIQPPAPEGGGSSKEASK